jgi:hypothetical protein
MNKINSPYLPYVPFTSNLAQPGAGLRGNSLQLLPTRAMEQAWKGFLEYLATQQKNGTSVKALTPQNAGAPPAQSKILAAEDPGANFRALFSGNNLTSAPTTPAASTTPAVPTAQSVFGPNPWATNPGGMAPNGVSYSYNHYYFATPATAQKVAQMVGGKVVEANAITPFGPFQQNMPNQMVQLPSDRVINAGLFASFYDHGYSQQFIDRLVSSEINDAPA